MRPPVLRFVVLNACLALAVACGGGGGGAPPGPSVTLTGVAPLIGPAAGGTPLTLTGSGFMNDGAGANTVMVGASAATGVSTVSDTTITCTSPPGPAGAADVSVTNATGSDTLIGGFAYSATPVVSRVVPGIGRLAGGTTVTVTGSGFMDNMAGPNQVRFGATLASGVVVQSDTSLRCVTPPGPAGPVTVTVFNDNGQDSLPAGYTYAAPVLYAADGKGTIGSLYSIDTSTGAATPIGAIGFSVTGLAMSPSGVLYATEAVRFVAFGIAPRLLTINTATGAGTVEAQLQDASGTPVNVPDITFVGDRLVGMTGSTSSQPCEIDPDTGLVTLLGATEGLQVGNALAADVADTLFLARLDIGVLSTVDPLTGVVTAGPALTGGVNEVLNAMSFLDGTLYAVDSAASLQQGGTPSDLMTLDPVTGILTPVGPLPNDVDAVAGNFK